MRPSILLTIPQIIPLAFLIITSITAPTISKLYIAKDSNNTIYGIFGYCSINNNNNNNYDCTSISIHTDLSSILSTNILNSSTINKLIPFLILTPISSGLTFLSLLLNLLLPLFLSFFKIFNFNNKIYWSLTLIISNLAFLTSTFICIIIFLIFYPYINWLGWCLIPTAIINLSIIIYLIFSFNYLSNNNNNEEEEKEGEKEEIDNDDEKFNNYNNFKLSNDIPQIEKSNNLNLMINSINSSTSSLFTKDNDDKNTDLIELTEKLNSNNSSLNLKVPEISNPYIDNNNINDNNINDNDINSDNRISDINENSSSNSSIFTSISQRPINPNYYAGNNYSNQINNRQPLNNSNNQNQNQNHFNSSLSKSPVPIPPPHQQQQQGQNNLTPQQYHQQRQFNQFNNQMMNMPIQNNKNFNNNYMRKPKPYMMMMNQRQNFPNNQNFNQNFNQNYNNQNQQFRPHNPYAPNPMMYKNRYRNNNNIQNLPATRFGNDGPYSGFR